MCSNHSDLIFKDVIILSHDAIMNFYKNHDVTKISTLYNRSLICFPFHISKLWHVQEILIKPVTTSFRSSVWSKIFNSFHELGGNSPYRCHLTFPNCWIWRGSHLPSQWWPPRSPDLNPVHDKEILETAYSLDAAIRNGLMHMFWRRLVIFNSFIWYT